jgi:hypothetical protein
MRCAARSSLLRLFLLSLSTSLTRTPVCCLCSAVSLHILAPVVACVIMCAVGVVLRQRSTGISVVASSGVVSSGVRTAGVAVTRAHATPAVCGTLAPRSLPADAVSHHVCGPIRHAHHGADVCRRGVLVIVTT